jgi:hypothetical protein
VKRARNLLLLALLAACLLSFWWTRRDETAAWPGDGPPPATRSSAGSPPATVHLAVLNGTGEPGLARRVGRRLTAMGCVVLEVGDAPTDAFDRSLLVNRRLRDDEAAGLARRLGGLPVRREWDPRRPEDAVLLLGRDHARLPLADAR